MVAIFLFGLFSQHLRLFCCLLSFCYCPPSVLNFNQDGGQKTAGEEKPALQAKWSFQLEVDVLRVYLASNIIHEG